MSALNFPGMSDTEVDSMHKRIDSLQPSREPFREDLKGVLHYLLTEIQLAEAEIGDLRREVNDLRSRCRDQPSPMRRDLPA